MLDAFSRRGVPPPEIVKLAVQSIPGSGTAAELLDVVSISARHIVAAIEALVRRTYKR